jgi:proteasome accessory factor C
MRRVLAVVPWIVANPGYTLGEVADRFGLTEKELLDDLHVVFMVGLPPYSPDALVDVQIDDAGRVSITLADFFSRPLRLNPEQGLALLASSDGLLSVPGTDPGGALARALTKLGAVVGVDEALDVHLGDAEASLLDHLREAARTGRQARLVYYSYGRDERNTRVVDPWRVFADGGSWYLHAWCHRAEEERVFRVDRIEELEVLAAEAHHRPSTAPDGERSAVFQPRSDDPRVVIRLTPEAFWVADYYPVEVIRRDDDEMVVELVATAVPWLERLLVRLGPAAEVLRAEGLDDATDLAGRAASRILARYRAAPAR